MNEFFVQINSHIAGPLSVSEIKAKLSSGVLNFQDTIYSLQKNAWIRLESFSELVHLKLSYIDFRVGYMRVLGKGGKERLVPYGEQASGKLQTYIEKTRPLLLKNRLVDEVFLNRQGRALSRQAVWQLFLVYVFLLFL